MLKLLKNKKWGEYKEYVRLLFTIRWSLKEVLKGEKKLRGRVVKKLSDALTEKSDVKIDLIGKVDGNFKEITNFFYITWEDTNGVIRNLTKSLEPRIKSLCTDIKKYKNKNPLKFAKRLWLKSLMTKDDSIRRKLNPLFSSDAALMYQVMSESEMLIFLLNMGVSNKIKNDIVNQIDEFKSRLAFVTIDISSVHKYLDNISKNKENNKVVINNLKNMIEFLQDETNKYTKKFLKRVKLSESTSPVIDKICQDPIII